MSFSISQSISRFWCIRVLSAAICLWLMATANGNASSAPKVLILNSYHKEFKWTDAQVDAAREVLSKAHPDIQLSVEYMDTKRLYNPDYLKTLFRLYEHKYKGVHFDAIITTDDNALRFVQKYHRDLFHETPVCFCGINDYKPALLIGKEQFTGVLEILDIKPTLDLALKLHPETKRVVVVVDSTPTGLGQLKDIKAVAAGYQNLKFEYLEGKNLSHTELLRKLRSLKGDGIVLLAVWLRDKNNTYLSSEDGGRLISKNAAVPVYGIIDMYLGEGIVGGKLLSSKTHGRIAAEMALQIIKGENPTHLPVIHHSTNPYMFDDTQLKRWNIPVSNLPGERIVINTVFSFYEAYKTIVWSALGLFLFLISLVLLLTLNIVRRNTAETALRESEQKYRILIETLTDMVFIVNPEGQFVYLNAEFENLTGYQEQDFIGRPFTEILEPEYVASTYDRFKRGLSGEIIPAYTVAFKRRKGKSVPVELKVTSFVDAHGKTIGRIGVARDISARENAKKALIESEERYRTVFQNTGTATVIIEADMTISMANAEFEKLTGFSKDAIENKKKWTDFVVSEHLEEMKRHHTNRRKNVGKAPTEYEFSLMDRQGNLRDIFLKIGVIPNSVKSIASLSDVTLLKQTREALSKSEHEKKAILDGITTNIRFVDKDLNIVWLNKASTTSAGKPSNAIIGHKCYEFWGNGQRACRGCPAKKAFKQKRTCQITKHSADGTVWDLKAEPVFDLSGELVGVVEIAHDITDQSRLEAQLQRAQKMEAIGTLAGGVAHDLNNILAGLVSYPELILLDLSEQSPLRNPILTIKKSGEKAAAIVQDLLTLARRGVAVKDVTNLNDVISEYVNSLEYENLLTYHPDVRVETHLDSRVLNMLGSPAQLSKTIMNLASNAAEAIPKDGKITLTTENRYIDKPIKGYDDVQEGDYVLLTIKDTGKGISPEDLEHIFEAFYTKKKMGRSGTGLGMAVVWGTVKDHNGYINVKSVEGKGTKFTLYFPVTRMALQEKRTETSLDTYRGNGESILIVDDVKEQREIASKMLTALGYRAATVSSGESTIEYLKKHQVDLVLLDMIMDPGMDGLETYQKIIEIHPGQKAVIASGFSESQRVKALQSLGAGAYVRKPLLLETIGSAIREELKKR